MSSIKGESSAATAKGLRDYQEDRYINITLNTKSSKGQLMAVMDGHGGASAAEKVAESVEGLFIGTIGKSESIEVALRKTVADLVLITDNEKSGTTLSLVYVPDGENGAYVAVLGDSPVIITDRNGVVNISPDHNVRSNSAELDAARGRGAIYEHGYIFDPQGQSGLQMSRALGDRNLARVLSRVPDIYFVELGSESIIIVASDGVYDPGHGDTSNQIHDVLDLVRNGADAEAVVNDALLRMTADNATAIVWRASSSKT